MLSSEELEKFLRLLDLFLGQNIKVCDPQYKVLSFELFKEHFSKSPSFEQFPHGDSIRESILNKLSVKYDQKKVEELIREFLDIWDEWYYACSRGLKEGLFKQVEE